MFSSSARRLVIANATRQSAASARTSQQCRRLAPSSARSFVSFAQTKHNDGRHQPPSVVSSTTTTCHQHSPSAARLLASADQRRQLSSGGDDLPYHIVVGMPALSPTMESGTISKWNVSEGDSFSAGDSLAVIETDKASMDFEAQDDGVVARLLVGEGGAEVNCGMPIMVTVEEEDDAGAFANFTPDATGGGGEAAESPPAPSVAASAPPPPPPADDLPYHIVVGMPALSPTMDAGTISKWNVAEGESFSAGDSLAVIETDKASIDFEAQDDGVVAKILAGAGSGEVAVGVPIMVTVEEEEDVAAFANYVAGAEEEGAPAAAAVEEVIAEPVAVAAAAPVPAAAPTPVAAPVAAPAVAAAPAEPTGAISMGGSSWGRLAAEASPLAKALASKQKQYIEKYGSTGHAPIV